MSRWWVSWLDAEPDYRPLHDPPNKAIIGWWCSGYGWLWDRPDLVSSYYQDMDMRGGYTERDHATLVAWVEAKTLRAAEAALKMEWPETKGIAWRFFDEVEPAWRPTNRFPLKKWMKERV